MKRYSLMTAVLALITALALTLGSCPNLNDDPPIEVGGLTAAPGGGSVTLSWTDPGGSFTSGGGVRVESDGTFTMTGGTISGNTASGNGGGVWVGNTGNFIKDGGTINGGPGVAPNNTASGSNGHAVYWDTIPLKKKVNDTLDSTSAGDLSTANKNPPWI
ncbi:hypothetical protein AGMMS49942_26960 [Spirochaetia bacterium]|nr:hypothetical protein AGMMS49942_26960 [Spirochaetia bacterium]